MRVLRSVCFAQGQASGSLTLINQRICPSRNHGVLDSQGKLPRNRATRQMFTLARFTVGLSEHDSLATFCGDMTRTMACGG